MSIIAISQIVGPHILVDGLATTTFKIVHNGTQLVGSFNYKVGLLDRYQILVPFGSTILATILTGIATRSQDLQPQAGIDS